MTVLKVFSPAKVNLFLETHGRREDGFTELDTVFCELDWGDELGFECRRGIADQLSCDRADLSCGPENLIRRALACLPRARQQGFQVSLTKSLPMGGGLGGGSSNAAASLKAGLTLLGLELPPEQIAAWALELGSDVPFFLRGGCQRGRGRGERLEPWSCKTLDLVLVCPPIHCSTAQVFRALEGCRGGPGRDPGRLREALAKHDLPSIADQLFNRLEQPAFELWPALAEVKQGLLERGCLGALMSGSGASVFGLCENREQAEAMASTMENARVVRACGAGPRGQS